MARKLRPDKPPTKAKGAHAPLTQGLPSKADIVAFIERSQDSVGKREIVRAFGIKGDDRPALKALLNELTTEGKLTGNRRALTPAGELPTLSEVDIVARDADGDFIGEPVNWEPSPGQLIKPRLLIVEGKGKREERRHEALGLGDRILARIGRLREGEAGFGLKLKATPVKKLPRASRSLLGIFHAHTRGGGEIRPVDKKALQSHIVDKASAGEAGEGDLVRFVLERSGRSNHVRAKVVETLGNPTDQRKISLIAIHAHGIPDEFPPDVIEEANGLRSARLEQRVDLTELPLITIDPSDARDHDDAVHASPDTNPANEGGFIVHVAIADVAYYVRPGSALDREAKLRGNSVYFPDRVVPMVPERLSNDLASLREGEPRAVLVVRMVFDKTGRKLSHAFSRALMLSAAKLSYEEAQAAIDGRGGAKARAILPTILEPLWAAYAALAKARDARGPLDLDLPERKIKLDAEGRVASILRPDRLAAHRLIEEFMIQANVAAAETLQGARQPAVYRVHDEPGTEKLKGLRDFLDTLGLKIAEKGSLKPADFNVILGQAKSLPVPDLVNEVVLRSQSQAVYHPENTGHFGLNLKRYAHFTSPIRRYADLIVHRALIRTCKLGAGGLEDKEADDLERVAKAISDAERRAMAAERETTDRLIAAHLADRVGAEFTGRISGVTKSGLFVKLTETGADGYIPAASLGGEYWAHSEVSHALIGQKTGTAYRLGDAVEVRLVEAVPSAGALRFEMLSEGKPDDPRARVALKGFSAGRGFRGRRR